jgi:hypothetical protein
MSWYDPALVGRIQTIKELQQRQFLPLEVIRETLARGEQQPMTDDHAVAAAITKVLERHHGTQARSKAELIARGVPALQLEWLARAKLAVPDADEHYRGDDLALLATLGAARKVGLGPEMLPFEILGEYLAAIEALVAIELRMFRAGVMPRATRKTVTELTTSATELSERLVVLLRRKLLLPGLAALVAEEKQRESSRSDGPGGRRVRRKSKSANRRRQRRGRTG